MRISDMIEDFIKDLFDDEDSIEIQRNDLAEKFNCVPSQINYLQGLNLHKVIMLKADVVVEDILRLLK